MTDRFAAYYDATAGRPPRRTLLAALERFGAFAGAAVDLGCGDGRDAVELLRRGWSVLAVDAEDDAIARLRARPICPGPRGSRRASRASRRRLGPLAISSMRALRCRCARPNPFPRSGVDRRLAPSGRTLRRPALWRARRLGGADGVTHHDRAAIALLLAGLEIELFEEEESDAMTPRGKAKHWHIFHIVARAP